METGFVTHLEFERETGLSNTTISKYLAALGYKGKPIPAGKKDEVVRYIRETYEKSRHASNTALVKARREAGVWDWRCAILGKCGWIVIRTGTEGEMTAWAAMLTQNGIKAQARRNEFRRAE